ncbi:MAG: hypothetical protein ACOYWZ_17505 [Bacillota bacterium]
MCAKFYPNYLLSDNSGMRDLGNIGGTRTGVSCGSSESGFCNESLSVPGIETRNNGEIISLTDNAADKIEKDDLTENPDSHLKNKDEREEQSHKKAGFNWMPFGGCSSLAGYGFSGSASFASGLKQPPL